MCEFNTYCIKKEVDVLQIKLGIFCVEIWRFYDLFKIVGIICWLVWNSKHKPTSVGMLCCLCLVYLSLPNLCWRGMFRQKMTCLF